MPPSAPRSKEIISASAESRRRIVDLGFVPVRFCLIEVAAFLDRVERYGVADDYRCVALREASAALADGKPERARRILEQLSDPTTEPEAVSSGKAAFGAWRPSFAKPSEGSSRRDASGETGGVRRSKDGKLQKTERKA